MCIYVYVAVGLMGCGCPRCLRLLQNLPQSGAGEAGRGLLNYRLCWHAASQRDGSVGPDQKNPFIFSCFLTSKSVDLGFRADLDNSLIVRGFMFHLLQGVETQPYKG